MSSQEEKDMNCTKKVHNNSNQRFIYIYKVENLDLSETREAVVFSLLTNKLKRVKRKDKDLSYDTI